MVVNYNKSKWLTLITYFFASNFILMCSGEGNSLEGYKRCPGKPEALKGERKSETIHEIDEKLLKENITFFLYKESSLGKGKAIKKFPILSSEDFDAADFYFFKILIHGFMSSCESFEENIIPEYLKEYEDVHVVCLDWGYFANPKDGYAGYKELLPSLPKIARAMAGFVQFLDVSKSVDELSDIHVVGFSLGAHLAGMIGTAVEEKLGEKVGRITGLDPAGPDFDNHQSNEVKLDKSDALFVDVIHTSLGRLGTSQALGHADFYMNDGKYQPRCESELDHIARAAEKLTGYCSHRTAYAYFAESINDRSRTVCNCESYKRFRKGKCACEDDTKVIFGEHCRITARGKFFVGV